MLWTGHRSHDQLCSYESWHGANLHVIPNTYGRQNVAPSQRLEAQIAERQASSAEHRVKEVTVNAESCGRDAAEIVTEPNGCLNQVVLIYRGSHEFLFC